MHVVHWILLVLAWFFLATGVLALFIPSVPLLNTMRNVAVAVILFLVCIYLIR